jgi:hypothetical protein
MLSNAVIQATTSDTLVFMRPNGTPVLYLDTLHGYVSLGAYAQTNPLVDFTLTGGAYAEMRIRNNTDPMGNHLEFYRSGGNNHIQCNEGAGGPAYLYIDGRIDDHVSACNMYFNENTSTTGSTKILFCTGNGTGTVQSLIDGKGNCYTNALSGNFGVYGVTSPAAPLHVGGDVSIVGDLYTGGTVSTKGTKRLSAAGILSLPGTSSQYIRGDGVAATLNQAAVAGLGMGDSVTQANLTLSAASSPRLRLNMGGSTTSYFDMIDNSSIQATLKKVGASGGIVIDFDPIPSDGTSSSAFRVFRNTTTSGTKTFTVFKGDGTNTPEISFGGTGVVNALGGYQINGSTIVDSSGNVTAASVALPLGGAITLKGGSNAKIGTGTLSSGAATIATTAVTANSVIFLTDTNSGIVNLGALTVSSQTAGTGFTVKSSNALDTSTFNWLIIEKG